MNLNRSGGRLAHHADVRILPTPSYIGWVTPQLCRIASWIADRIGLTRRLLSPSTMVGVRSLQYSPTLPVPTWGRALVTTGCMGTTCRFSRVPDWGLPTYRFALNVHFSGAGTPVTLTCGTATTNFTGNVDQWGAASLPMGSRLDTANTGIFVQLFSDGVLLGNTFANIPRPDLIPVLATTVSMASPLRRRWRYMEGRLILVTVRPVGIADSPRRASALACP